jgi:hypothetical protein
MARRSHAFELDASPASASRAVRQAISEAGWEAAEMGDHVVAHEDATKLSCTISPVKAEIRVREQNPRRAQIQLDGWVAGWGPIANRQLPDRLRMLERVIRKHCARPG